MRRCLRTCRSVLLFPLLSRLLLQLSQFLALFGSENRLDFWCGGLPDLIHLLPLLIIAQRCVVAHRSHLLDFIREYGPQLVLLILRQV